jgi:hypothetical protein
VKEDRIPNSFHTTSVTKGAHRLGPSFDFHKSSFDKVRGANPPPPVNYYQDHEIVYISELDFHRPFVLHQQDSLETQRSLSKIFFMENREMPILHKPWAFGETFHQQAGRFLFVGISRQTK